MFSEEVIKVSSLSKCFEIYQDPKDRLKQIVYPSLRNIVGLEPKQYYNEFWALKEIDFSIKRGQTVGIVGRNGSGKSTLLQTICGTLTPTSGSVETSGRIAALLELGSGFNPEFTGRENVYLNASLYGLTEQQISERFERIERFADIGEFIEQPVKTYSSGMMVRLAFAVIAHVDADILIVDEALSVGDAVFTQKCMRFIRQFQENGTLLFVSHDTSAVQNLCETAIWLSDGTVRQIGTAKDVSEAYLQYSLQETYGNEANLKETVSETDNASNELLEAEVVQESVYSTQNNFKPNLNDGNGWTTGAGRIIDVTLTLASGEAINVIEGGEKVRLTIKAEAYQDFSQPILGFLVKDRLGQDLFGENTLPFSAIKHQSVKTGETLKSEFEFTLPMLPNGQYSVMASLADGDLYNNIQHHWLHEAAIITVSSSTVRWGLVGVKFDNVSMSISA